MTYHDLEYTNLLREVLQQGSAKSDRTGTGTLSSFGCRMRFDLSLGFPLLTTKVVPLKHTAAELLWFVSGSTNVADLPEYAQKWWTPWQGPDGDLGPIYGEQYRKNRWWFEVEPLIFDAPVAPDVSSLEATVFGVGDLGQHRRKTGLSPDKEPEHIRMLKTVWREMLRRCYSKGCDAYAAYGAKGVHVSPEWHSFDNFVQDAVHLPGWSLKLEYPDDYSLDKDILCASNRYSRETCMWASRAEQGWNTSTNTPFVATDPLGVQHTFPSLGEMCRAHGVNVSAVHRALRGALHTHHGWTNFRYLNPEGGKVLRFRELDQLKLFVADLKHSPDSRRHVMTLWNSAAMQHAKLPCCHGSVIQGYVANGRLSLQVYQRSADLFIGVPVNIASYALLTHMLAQQCGLGVGDLVWVGGDCHIYSNHATQVEEQLSRAPRPSPTLRLARRPDSIFDYTLDDFIVEGYDPHPAIKAPVAV